MKQRPRAGRGRHCLGRRDPKASARPQAGLNLTVPENLPGSLPGLGPQPVPA
jgi:hypothetical protein